MSQAHSDPARPVVSAAEESLRPRTPHEILLPLDVAELRRVYELGVETIPAICARFGLTPWQIRRLREAEGWTSRDPAVPAGLGSGPAPGARALRRRLKSLLALGMALLEERLADEGINEANARLLTELCRTQEMVMRATTPNKTGGKPRETKTHDGPDCTGRHECGDDPDDATIRAELARRILRIRRAAGLEDEARRSNA